MDNSDIHYPTLVLGIGNEWAADDGVGPAVVRRVQQEWHTRGRNATREVGFVVMARPDLSLLDHLADARRLIIVDAVVGGAAPGTLHRQVWRPGATESRGVERASSHGFGVEELLQMAAALGKLPPLVELWGIEIASTEPGSGLTPAVARATEQTARELLALLPTPAHPQPPSQLHA
jgi:hydrogenase maturation protease